MAVGPQYDTTHVYVAPEDFDRFVSSLLATFGGTTTKQGVFTVTPTPSSTMSQLVLTPVGSISVFGFKTPIPYPFGVERTGYLVTDMDAAIQARPRNRCRCHRRSLQRSDRTRRHHPVARRREHATVLAYNCTLLQDACKPFRRIESMSQRTERMHFVRSFLAFSHGKVVSDDAHAPGIEIGRPGETYRRIRIESKFGKLTVLVTDGHLPYPYGREMTGYEVTNLTRYAGQGEGGRSRDSGFSLHGRSANLSCCAIPGRIHC